MSAIPDSRIRPRDAVRRNGASYVLYWMIAARRTRSNFGLQRALEHCREQRLPLVVLEALRCDYPWASARFHGFVVEGMRENAQDFRRRSVTYYPYVEREPGGGRGLLARLAEQAAIVVTDDFPCFFLPRMLAAARGRIDVPIEAVDGNGIYPMRSTERVFTTAASFRRHLHKELPPHLSEFPTIDPLASYRGGEAHLPAEILRRWPMADLEDAGLVRALPIDHTVGAGHQRGGRRAALRALSRFLADGFDRYHTDRNQPGSGAESGLSPYLHFGHIGSHEVFKRILSQEQWSPERIADRATGSRTGWWGASAPAEAFLDQLVTWRELGFNRCALDHDYDSYDTLPSWALQTLDDHAADPRSNTYSLEEFESAATHDPLWNAAQRQLVRDGIIHGYLRMLWGKKILEWTPHPRDALEILIELNNKYAVDGRDPNSYSGIFWILGRFDRAWGPERPIFGKVRYMSSESTARKLRLRDYLEHYAE